MESASTDDAAAERIGRIHGRRGNNSGRRTKLAYDPDQAFSEGTVEMMPTSQVAGCEKDGPRASPDSEQRSESGGQAAHAPAHGDVVGFPRDKSRWEKVGYQTFKLS